MGGVVQMETLGTAIVFATFAAVWIAFSRFLKNRNTGAIIRHVLGATAGAVTMVVMAGVLIAAGVLSPATGTNGSAAVEVAKTSQESESVPEKTPPLPKEEALLETTTQTANMGITTQDFVSNFNKALAPLDMPFKAPSKPPVTAGAVNDVFNIALDDYISLIGTLDKRNGLIKNLTLIGTGDGTPESGVRIMSTTVAMFMAVGDSSSDNNKDAAAKTLVRLFEKQEASGTDSASTNRSGLKFTITRSKQLGTWFSVEPAI